MIDILNLTGLKTVRVVEDDDEYVIEAESAGDVPSCPDCPPGLGHLYDHGSEQQLIRDTPIHGKTVRIALRRRRYQCQRCRKTMFEPLDALDGKRLATRRLIAYLQ